MPGVAVLPNPGQGPGVGGYTSSSKWTSAHPAYNNPPSTISAPHNGGSTKFHDDMSVAEIKAKARESVAKEARGASALSLIRTAQTQLLAARDYDAKGDLKSALGSYIKTATLAKMTFDSSEFTQEKKGKGGVLRKELHDFLEGEGRELSSLTQAVEEKLKAIENRNPPSNGRESNDANANVTHKAGGSIAERMRALQENGLSIAPTKRISRDVSNLPTPPLSPTRFPPPQASTSSMMSLNLPSPPSSSVPSPVFVPTSALGPPSPQSSPSSSPQMNNHYDLQGFQQSFPSIDELDENPPFTLPSVPTGVSTGSNKSATRDHRNTHIPQDSSPIITSFRNFTVPIERPSSTPVTPVNHAFASRPASPTKGSFPMKSSGLAGSSVTPSSSSSGTRVPLPVRNGASPSELLSYMQDYNVLLIDVRDRAQFDKEHIKSDAVVCIEPYVLKRTSVNAEMLEDAMSVAPRREYSLFANRDKFDLVAVYDYSSISFGSKDSSLSILVRAISEQAFKKMLKRMPMMLVGGIEAWKRDLGDAELKRSGSSSPSYTEKPIPTTNPMNGTFSSSNQNGTLFNPASFASASGAASSGAGTPHEVWTPPSRQQNTGDSQSRQLVLDQPSGHTRYPADVTYSANQANFDRPLTRKPALTRPPSSSISYSRSMADNIPPPIPISSAASIANGAPSSSSSITYPQFPRQHISTPASASPFTAPPSHYDIASPPQASINPSQLSRRRSDFVDQSQEALSTFNSRPSIDYPELSSQMIRPPPAAASPVLERQDNRPRIKMAPQPFPPSGPKPPRNDYEYPVTYWADIQVGTSGLKNMGNTCYMNAPIQCLSATVPFARFFTEGRWKTAVNFVNPMGSQGKLASAFAKLVQEMWGGDMPYLVPADFRKAICILKSQYNGSEQHDSQEFLSFLIDGIHEDLNRVVTKPNWVPTPEQEEELESLPPQIASEREWGVWRSRNDSLIVDFFQGQFRNRLECLTCHKTSTTYNVFSILQLPIPSTGNGKVHIKNCLDKLLDEETLEKDDAWDCPRCKVKRRASKKLSLARLPPILLIHFKRFKYKGAFVDKVDTFIDFPVKYLDLTNYMPPPAPPGTDKTQLNGGLPMSPDDPRTQLPPYRYELYGVTNHYGYLSSGHYTAFIASRGGWMYCDDSSVKAVDPKQVVNQKAYVLFYKRVRS